MATLYRLYNSANPTTSSITKQPTGSGLRTMLQLSSKSGIDLRVREWGCSFDGSSAATPGVCELIETDVAATALTASASGDVLKMNNPGGPAADTALITLGTGNTGFAASAPTEGSITVTRVLDAQLVAPTNQYIYQWVVGTEPIYQAGKFLRIRMNFGTTINAICWIDFEA